MSLKISTLTQKEIAPRIAGGYVPEELDFLRTNIPMMPIHS